MAINLTFEEAAEKLQNLYKSAEYNELIKKRSQTTYLEAMHKERSETIFSSLIQWIIENPDFNKESETSPLMFLLRLLALTAVKQEKDEDTPKVEVMDSNVKKTEKRPLMGYALRNSIQGNDVVISNIEVKTEENTNSEKGKGRIDLTIKCDVKSKEEEDSDKDQQKNSKKEKIDLKLRILLENKVDSEEEAEKMKDGTKKKIQCEKYFDSYTKGNKREEGVTNVFVFLSIDKPKPENISSPHFIKITYQELLDNVLNLTMIQSSRYPESSARYLKDFVDTITTLKTGGKRNIAYDFETTKHLEKFYTSNRDIIFSAVLEGCDDTKENGKKLKEAIKQAKDIRKKEFEVGEETKSLLKNFYNGNRDFIDASIIAGCKNDTVTTALKEYQSKRDYTKYYLKYNGELVYGQTGKNKTTTAELAKSNVAFEVIKILWSKMNLSPSEIAEKMTTLGRFWIEQDGTAEPPKTAKLVGRDNKGKAYYVKTGIYDPTKFDTLKQLLDSDSFKDFELIPVD